jgi:hypothetical protein
MIVLGPQASSPARAAKNQLRFIERLKCYWLSWTRAGEDACGPRTIVPGSIATHPSSSREPLAPLRRQDLVAYLHTVDWRTDRAVGSSRSRSSVCVASGNQTGSCRAGVGGYEYGSSRRAEARSRRGPRRCHRHSHRYLHRLRNHSFVGRGRAQRHGRPHDQLLATADYGNRNGIRQDSAGGKTHNRPVRRSS